MRPLLRSSVALPMLVIDWDAPASDIEIAPYDIVGDTGMADRIGGAPR